MLKFCAAQLTVVPNARDGAAVNFTKIEEFHQPAEFSCPVPGNSTLEKFLRFFFFWTNDVIRKHMQNTTMS